MLWTLMVTCDMMINIIARFEVCNCLCIYRNQKQHESYVTNVAWQRHWATTWLLPAVKCCCSSYKCLSGCKIFKFFCEGLEFGCPPPPIHLQWKDRLPIFLPLLLGPGPWQLADGPSLVFPCQLTYGTIDVLWVGRADPTQHALRPAVVSHLSLRVAW